MITPRVRSVKDGRADFQELVPVHDDHVCLDDGEHAHVSVWRAPDGSDVALVSWDSPGTIARAEALGSNLPVPQGAHLFVSAPVYEDGFEEALDARLPSEVRLSLLEQKPDPPEVLAVPWPDPVQPVAVALTISESDFESLTSQACAFEEKCWNFLDLMEAWDPVVGAEVDDEGVFERAYIITQHEGWASVMLAKAFLQGHRQAYEIACDGDGDWWVLTDFKTARVRRHEEQQRVRERLEREAAEKSGDPVARAYYGPDAEKDDKEQSSGE